METIIIIISPEMNGMNIQSMHMTRIEMTCKTHNITLVVAVFDNLFT